MRKATIIIPSEGIGAEAVVDKVKRGFDESFGGHSAYEGTGAWIDDDGNRVSENHIRIETHLNGEPESAVYSFARYVKDELNEDAVTVEIQDVNVEYV